ncbi:MAG: 16S rRNA (uracil(1498)-N(3))-methyltransferase [Turicibacter sp.]|nr:16S rRNA (uracil(1498)-N(3))-methyltransferase [Turicibacter sp.]
MQRYFLKNEQIASGRATIIGDDAHHITRVMRGASGDRIIVCDEGGACFLAALKTLGTDVVADIISPLQNSTEMPVPVTIAQGLPKGDKLELVLQKGTECGATAFIPVSMARSVVKLDAKKSAKKLERWQKIVKESAEQAHRQKVPAVHDVLPFAGLLKQAEEYDLKLFAFEETAKSGEMSQLKKSLAGLSPHSKVLLLVGPEGGISEGEASDLVAAGFLPCALGPRILRTETAALYLLSAISYQVEL